MKKACKSPKAQLQAKPVTKGKAQKPPRVTAPERPASKGKLKVPPTRPQGEAPWPTFEQDAKQTLEAMSRASKAFYAAAVATGCHAFIEFAGLMNEYINICADMSREGDHSWLVANTHTNKPLKMHAFQMKYLTEKLNCIYGPSLRASLEFAKALLKGAS